MIVTLLLKFNIMNFIDKKKIVFSRDLSSLQVFFWHQHVNIEDV